MPVFTRETTDYIADQFTRFYSRKYGPKMTVRDARILIDFVAGPVPAGTGTGATDYSRPRISGGGSMRPTQEMYDAIITRYTPDEETEGWNNVFNQMIEKYAQDKAVTCFMEMIFKDGASCEDICETFHIEAATFYRKRLTLLEQAGVIAYSKKLIKL